jgi:hypothetical protein
MAKPVSVDLDFQNQSHIINYPGGFPPEPAGHKFVATFGNTTQTAYQFTHNLGTKDLIVQVYSADLGMVEAGVFHTSVDVTTVELSAPPGAGALRVIILK